MNQETFVSKDDLEILRDTSENSSSLFQLTSQLLNELEISRNNGFTSGELTAVLNNTQLEILQEGLSIFEVTI